MLSYSRCVGQLSRITRHTHAKNFPKPLKHIDIASIGYLRYSSKSKKPKTGTTAKVEECVPKTKTYTKVPPLPPVPPPPHATTPSVQSSQDIKPPLNRRAPCEDRNFSCPPDCPPRREEECFKPGGPEDDSKFKYWKHLIAALILAGVSAYAYAKWFMDSDKIQKKKVVKTKPEIVKNPSDSGAFPDEVQFLLIGGGTAAFTAFRSIKANDPTAKVLVVTNEGDLPYMRPPLSKELWYNKDDSLSQKLIFRQWNGAQRCLFYEPPEFYLPVKSLADSEKGGVAVATGWEIKKIDPYNKIAFLDNDAEIKYDKCLIATGSSPKNLSIFETANKEIKEKVIVFRTKEDYLELVQNIRKPEVKNIVIIGGGFLGSELSTSLARNLFSSNQQVYQIYKEKYVMAQVLPEYLSKWTTKRTEDQGVKCIPDLEVHDCALKNNRIELTLKNGDILEADQVVVAIGVEANTQLAEESGLEVDPDQGGFLVNAELEARSNLWVAGDAACFYDIKLGRRRIEHHDHAVISGKLAGENMTGAGKPYVHQSMFWSDLGPEVGFEAIGIIDSTLETVGVFAKATEEDARSDTAIEYSDKNIESTSKESIESVNNTQSTSELTAKSTSNDKKLTCPDKNDQNTNKEVVGSATVLEDFGKGVVFYLRNNIVVGIVLWNIFNRMTIARQLLQRGTKYEELNEAAKLFSIHED